MDRTALKLVDWVGDYLQERRGIPLPSIRHDLNLVILISFALYVSSSIFFAVYERSETMVGDLVLVVFLLALWSTHMLGHYRELPALRRDLENWDEPNVRKLYMAKAVFYRELTILAFLRSTMAFLTLVMFAVTAMAVLTNDEGRSNSPIVMNAVFLTAYTIKNYVECMIPKAPTRRREQLELRPATVRGL